MHVSRTCVQWGGGSAGVMVFGNEHLGYNISNATIARNTFVRNGAGQTSPDHGEHSPMLP